ncbi:DUF5687 family protein [Aureivirga sp. CE67]|uniref:DUF5687 family protein n=1 Tax=Aureivirga sp. CE67 TaxID=1788983 RepID=UPI0018CB90A5|nr:DUF5687 family protein [Aureivirga sp. CE67]
MEFKFLKLEFKKFFRSSHWQKSIALKILMSLGALYILALTLIMGFGGYFILEEFFPERAPFSLVNSFLWYVISVDLLMRYFLQKMPVMNVKPLLILPIKKSKMVHYLIRKTLFSFFNIYAFVFLVPFSFFLVYKGNLEPTQVITWVVSILFLILTNNSINFLLNKNDKFFFGLLGTVAVLFGLQYFQIFDITIYSEMVFSSFYNHIWLITVPLMLFIASYIVVFKFTRSLLYLDKSLKKGTKDVETTDLSWLDRFGNIAPFIKNDVKLIWRNKRPRSVLFMSAILLGYGLIFLNNPRYADLTFFNVMIFLLMTGAFLLNFGQFIPAWDASFYKMLMSQNIKYEQYLNSKRYLMTMATTLLFLLAIPYVYFGIENIYYLIAAYLYNIGVNTFALLFLGAFNKKKIELGKAAAFNYQGSGLAQWLAGIPTFGIPVAIVSLGSLFGHLYIGLGVLGFLGVVGLIFQKFWMKKIAELYIKRKYITIEAFSN